MQDVFDPETMLLSDELILRYEKALERLPKRSLYVWLLYRNGFSARRIASSLMRYDKKKISKRQHDAYRKKVKRVLIEIKKELKKWCLKKQ